jgi:sialate O-acetylesterase
MVALMGLVLGAIVAVTSSPAAAPDHLALPSFLSDHMVLQRGGAVLWGWAAPGSIVVVTVKDGAGKVLATGHGSAAAAAGGDWSVPISVSEPQPTSMVEVNAGSASVLLSDVAWGDVFLCSGQSNSALAHVLRSGGYFVPR